MDQSRSKSPFGIRQIARISLGIVRVEASHPRGESARVSEVTAAARIAPGSGAAQPVSAAMRAIHNANNGAKWNRCIHGPASCWQDATARAWRNDAFRGEFSMDGRRRGGLAPRIHVRNFAGEVQSAFDCGGAADFLLQQQHAVEQRLCCRRTAGHVDIDRHDAVAAAHHGIGIMVVAAAVGA